MVDGHLLSRSSEATLAVVDGEGKTVGTLDMKQIITATMTAEPDDHRPA